MPEAGAASPPPTAGGPPVPGQLSAEHSVLFVCDMQERFRSVIPFYPTLIDTSKRMLQAATLLNFPVVVTEQYPKAFGKTVGELASSVPPGTAFVPKTRFSMVVPEVEQRLRNMPHVKQVVLVGIEAHVCVLQTTLDLLQAGYEVHLIVDGLSSQHAHDRAVALKRMARAGAHLSTSEAALFQMLRDAQHPQLKAVSALCRRSPGVPLPFASSL